MNRRAMGTLRIIGGEWRSRLVHFDAESGVRPTPDRVRQTVFDWLAPFVDGSRVLDLFAGSGALGLEALSRGARHASFVDSGRAQVEAIRAALVALKATDRAEVSARMAIDFLRGSPSQFDLVFLDPPYDAGLLGPSLEVLPPWLAATHRIYVEWPKAVPPQLPPGYAVLKEKSAGQVSCALLVHRPPQEAET